jgi:hypothetical protein
MRKINQNIVKKFILLLLIKPALTMAMVAPFQLDITCKGFDK